MAGRQLLKDRQSTILNLIGLSTGLACAILIFAWVKDEYEMDQSQGNDVYHVMENRVKSGGIWSAPTTSGPMAEAMANEFPEIEKAVVTRPVGTVTLTVGDKNLKAEGKRAGAAFFEVFNYPLVVGDPKQLLNDKSKIALSDSLAIRLFGSVEKSIGQTLEWDHQEQYKVAGIFRAIDGHHADLFDFVASIQLMFDQNEYARQWGNTGAFTFVKLKTGTNLRAFNQKIAGFVKAKTEGKVTHRTPFLFPYNQLYLHGNFENGVSTGGRIDYVHLFSIIAIFILIIACINFINLSTAKASRRNKEVGIKKVLGASRGELVVQYLGESLLLAFLALTIAVILVTLLLPSFNQLTGKSLVFEFSGSLLAGLFALTIFTGLMAGSYPAIYLSGFQPGLVLKGKLAGSARELLARKGLVVFQFTLSVVMIVAVIAVYKQIRFVQDRNLGFKKENVITIPREGKLEESATLQTFLSEIESLPGVKHASAMGHNLTGHWSGTYGVKWPGRDPEDKTEFENLSCDYGLVETLGMKLKAGRTYSRSFGADSAAIVFNEAAIAYMGMKDPIGKTVELWGQPRTIIGVVENFHYESLHKTVSPVFFNLSPDNCSQLLVSVDPGSEKKVIEKISQMYPRFNPGFAFDYNFLEERFKSMYLAEQRVSVLSRYFAGLAILISCLGLFGLAAYTAQSRQKEISIRKVIGASFQNIVLLLSTDFLKLIIIAILIAVPLSWWAVSKWLAGFAYRTDIGYGIFVIATISILLISFATIAAQSVKAALRNPVDSLKNE